MSKNTDVIDLQSLVACFSLCGEKLEHRLEVIQSSGLKIGSLDTVPATINGGMWYEVANGTPIVKIYYGGNEYPLGSGALEPTLTVAPSSLNVPAGGSASATISCDSGGNYLVTSLTEGVTAELVDNVITVAHVPGIEEASVKIRVMASSGFNAAEILLPVAMAKASPNLTITPSADTVPCAGSITAEVSYSGSGTISVSGDTVTPTYDANTQTIIVPYNGHESSATITVNLTASTGYLAATQSFTVAMEEPRTILTVTPSATATKGDTITVPISCNSGGTISISTSALDQTELGWTWDGETLTIPFVLLNTISDVDIIYTVSVTANDIYPAASTTLRITYFGGSVAELEKLAIAMPFNDSPTEDICGNTWTATGTPQVVHDSTDFDGSIHFDGSSYLTGDTNIDISSGEGYNISFWLYYTGPAGSLIYSCLGGGVNSHSNGTQFQVSGAYFNNPPVNTWIHVEYDYLPNVYPAIILFINGANARQTDGNKPAATIYTQSFIGGHPGWSPFKGYINNFKVYTCSRHRANFTCPARPT